MHKVLIKWFLIPIGAALLFPTIVSFLNLDQYFPPEVSRAIGRGISLCIVAVTSLLLVLGIIALWGTKQRSLYYGLSLGICAVAAWLTYNYGIPNPAIAVLNGIFVMLAVLYQTLGCCASLFFYHQATNSKDEELGVYGIFEVYRAIMGIFGLLTIPLVTATYFGVMLKLIFGITWLWAIALYGVLVVLQVVLLKTGEAMKWKLQVVEEEA